jgi:type IV secretory pathway TrbF-like protein
LESDFFNGIKFYQIPAFSNAKSLWDDKVGHTMSKAEVTGFLIDDCDGMTNIFKQYL